VSRSTAHPVGGTKADDSKRPRAENARLKKLVADQPLDIDMHQAGDPIPGPHRGRLGTMDDAVEASAQCVCDRVRLPIPDRYTRRWLQAPANAYRNDSNTPVSVPFGSV